MHLIMESIGHFIWIIFTFPIWFFLSAIWIIIKFIFWLISFLIALIKYGINSLEDLLMFPFRILRLSLDNYDAIYQWFSNFYYDHTFLSIIGIITLFFIYSNNSKYYK